MENGKKYLYAKFKLDSKLKVMENLILSEDRSTVDKWTGKRQVGKKPKQTETENEPRSSFEKVEKDFESDISVFQVTVPFIMRYLPFIWRLFDDRSIRQVFAKRGERLEKGEFQLYRVSIDQMASIAQRLEESKAIGSGINSIPSLFMMGLMSAYDVFLSQLIRCIFVACPEFLSSSERNISLKDLVEIGSIEAAREMIIENEVEPIIRDSHHQQIY